MEIALLVRCHFYIDTTLQIKYHIDGASLIVCKKQQI